MNGLLAGLAILVIGDSHMVTNDYLADPTGVALIRAQLPKGAIVADVVQNGYAHMVSFFFRAKTRARFASVLTLFLPPLCAAAGLHHGTRR